MGRLKTMSLGILNIKTHPNSPENYLNLMKDLFYIKPSAKIRGSDFGTPKALYSIELDKPLNGLSGIFFKYLEIDQDKPWLDLKKGETIVDSNGQPIPQVDESKRPNAKEIEFVFYPNGHRLFINIDKISAKSAQNFLAGLFLNSDLQSKYGVVDVEVETSAEAIEKILKIPSLSKLEIIFSRPNDDDLNETEERVMERIKGQNIRRLKHEIATDADDGIVPDEETIALMNIAVSNGKVKAEGYAGEEKVTESTETHPYIERRKFDPSVQTFLSAMADISSSVLGNFTSRKGK